MRGCYKCGSLLGNEAQLCPACNEKKLQQNSVWHERKHPSRADTRNSFLPSTSAIFSAGAVVLVLLSIGWVYRSHIRVFTGTASADDIYQICLEGGKQMTSQAKNTVGKAFVSGIMVEICSDMKKSCTEAPHGEKCQKAREFLRMMARG